MINSRELEMLIELEAAECVSQLTALPLTILATKVATSLFDPTSSTYNELANLRNKGYVAYGVRTTRANTYYITEEGLNLIHGME